MHEILNQIIDFDIQIFLKINSWNSIFFDKVMYAVSGQIIWIPYFLFIIFLFIKKDKKKALIAILFLIFAIGISDFISFHGFKQVIKRLRPCHNPAIESVVHIVKNHCGGKYGFVSSHAANFFSIAMFSGLYINKKYFYYLSFGIAIIVAYSRIYLGVHYPLDIVGGALLGMFISFIFFKILNKIIKNKT